MGYVLDSLEESLMKDAFTGEIKFKRSDLYRLHLENNENAEDIADFLKRITEHNSKMPPSSKAGEISTSLVSTEVVDHSKLKSEGRFKEYLWDEVGKCLPTLDETKRSWIVKFASWYLPENEVDLDAFKEHFSYSTCNGMRDGLGSYEESVNLVKQLSVYGQYKEIKKPVKRINDNAVKKDKLVIEQKRKKKVKTTTKEKELQLVADSVATIETISEAMPVGIRNIYSSSEKQEFIENIFSRYDSPIIKCMSKFINFLETSSDVTPKKFKDMYKHSSEKLELHFESLKTPYKLAMKFFNEVYTGHEWSNKAEIRKYMFQNIPL